MIVAVQICYKPSGLSFVSVTSGDSNCKGPLGPEWSQCSLLYLPPLAGPPAAIQALLSWLAAHQHVIKDLAFSGITELATVHSALLLLPNLARLNLAAKHLLSVPSDVISGLLSPLARMKSLQQLTLGLNVEPQGGLPFWPSLSGLTGLQSLDLLGPRRQGIIGLPRGLPPTLTRLACCLPRQHSCSAALASLRGLRSLALYFPAQPAAEPADSTFLSALTGLRSLELGGPGALTALPEAITKLTRLTDLDVIKSRLAEADEAGPSGSRPGYV